MTGANDRGPVQGSRTAARRTSARTGAPRRKRFIDYPRSRYTGVRHWLPSWKLVTGTFLGLIFVGIGVLVAAYATTTIPDPAEFAESQVTTVYYADGTTPMGTFAEQQRVLVDYSTLPDWVGKAVVASEDDTFYTNRGISPRGMARAFINNLRGGATQGGSTITQQYAERYYSNGTTKSYVGKFKEAILAVKLGRAQDKDEILGRYLNTIYLGRGTYGIQAAAQAYFGVNATDLTVSQAALIAGIIPSPSNWDPAKNPTRAEERWNRALDRMVAGGWLTAEERATQVFPPTIEVVKSDTMGGTNGYLLQMVKDELTSKSALTEDQLYRQGLSIVTTIDKDVQAKAVDAVGSLPEGKDPHTKIALVSIEPSDGGIVALYGGPDYLTQARNAVTQDAAQAGSTFKPFTLIAALKAGIPLTTTFSGTSPMDVPGFGKVSNYGNSKYGTIDLVKATANSVNTVYAQLNVQVGPEKTAEVAKDAGVRSTVETNPANVLGTDTVHPLDMASAYATIADGGYYNAPHIVKTATFIKDGAVAYKGAGTPEKKFEPDVIADATFAMQQVVQSGSGAAYVKPLGRPVAGKTGTSQENKSAWFVGFTAGPTDVNANRLQLATAVAMYQSNDDGSQAIITGWGKHKAVTGGTWPAYIWANFMKPVMDGKEKVDFPPRANVGAAQPTSAPTTSTTAPPEPTPTTQAPTVVDVPGGLAGMLRADAEAAVLAAGLQPATVQKNSDTVPAGTVISANPASGTLPTGGTVTLEVSTGPAAPKTPEPTATKVVPPPVN